MTPTAENSVLQISGVVSGERNITCSAMAQRPSLQFSMADVRVFVTRQECLYPPMPRSHVQLRPLTDGVCLLSELPVG
jgi:hypothetical protein